MKKYIQPLMELYQEMNKENEVFLKKEEEERKKKYAENIEHFLCYQKPYSDTMMKYMITIIHKLSNNAR